MGGDLDAYRATMDELERDIRLMVDRMTADGLLPGSDA
jgi:hypothetical protein